MAADASSDDELHYRILDRHEVSLGNEGEKDYNTIVVGGADLVLPVEMDLDGDPLQDDVVSLRSVHGLYEQTLSSRDPDVTPDADQRLFYYRFRHVPAGLYRLAARIRSSWVTVTRDILVSKAGVFVGDKQLTADKPTFKAAEPEPEPEDEIVTTPDGCER
jgi:hypothetical protein